MARREPLDCTPALSETVEALRAVIHESVPGVEERVYKGRTSAGYHDRHAGAFCGLFTDRRAVRLVFPHRVRLPKPERILKDGYYVEFGPMKRIPRAALTRVIHAALLTRL